MVREELMAEADKHIPNFDYLVDLFDLKFLWVSQLAINETGFTMDEFLQMRNIDIVADGTLDETQLRKELIERITKVKGEKEYVIKSKNKGNLSVHFAYHAFEFDGGWYMIGKIISITPVSVSS